MKHTSVAAHALLLLGSFFFRAPAQDSLVLPSEGPGSLDAIVEELSRITGLPSKRKVVYETMNRDQLREYFQKRIREVVKPEEIRIEELTLKKFGFVPPDYDLEKNTIDLLTEQAAGFYDYRAKKMVLMEGWGDAMAQIALVHELAHALADQHFDLEKFIENAGKSDDRALARAAVMEGQATWLMAEHLARRTGSTLMESPWLLQMMSRSAAMMGDGYPVFSSAPLYVRESLIFPYLHGLRFQHEAYKKLGQKSFAEVFRNPPLTTREVLHPETYFERSPLPEVRLPPLPSERRYRKLAEGTLGQFDHSILLRQYVPGEEALAEKWRGGRYCLWEEKNGARIVLVYVSHWAGPETARRYFEHYRKVLEGKWGKIEIEREEPELLAGTGDDGHFQVRLAGERVISIEGLPHPLPIPARRASLVYNRN